MLRPTMMEAQRVPRHLGLLEVEPRPAIVDAGLLQVLPVEVDLAGVHFFR